MHGRPKKNHIPPYFCHSTQFCVWSLGGVTNFHQELWKTETCDGVLRLLCPVLPGRWLQAQGLLHFPRNICSGAQSHWGRGRKFKISENIPNIVPWTWMWEPAVTLSKWQLVQNWNFNSSLRNLKLEQKSRKDWGRFAYFLLPIGNYEAFLFFHREKAPRKFLDSCLGIIKNFYLGAS